ncbi:MAG: hypothetical protein JW714_00965 [Candidatus Omnitrophica bacterium]|nr:hypothetical protein [Candidatus Omnitrophota bacterium]
MLATFAAILFLLTAVLGLVNLTIMFAWKRKELPFLQASFQYPFKYGLFWCWRHPELYFQRYAKLAMRLATIWIILFVVTILLLFIPVYILPLK